MSSPTREAPRTSTDVAALTPPVIDVSVLRESHASTATTKAIAAEIEAVCSEVGLFVALGHGVERELETAFEAAQRFFGMQPAIKDQVPRVNRYGYVPDRIEARQPHHPSYSGRSSLAAEYLDIGLADEVDIDAIEALGCHGFSSAIDSYRNAALGTAHGVLEALSVTLGVPGYFSKHMRQPQCRMRLLHYPVPGPEFGDDLVPVFSTPHTDYGVITLLATDGVSGLEVLSEGQWRPVIVDPGAIIVQLGDMLARWTNDRFRSTPHRVVGSSGMERYSIPFFVNPDPDTVVATIPSCVNNDQPARYEPVTAGNFLRQRIDGDSEPYLDT